MRLSLERDFLEADALYVRCAKHPSLYGLNRRTRPQGLITEVSKVYGLRSRASINAQLQRGHSDAAFRLRGSERLRKKTRANRPNTLTFHCSVVGTNLPPPLSARLRLASCHLSQSGLLYLLALSVPGVIGTKQLHIKVPTSCIPAPIDYPVLQIPA